MCLAVPGELLRVNHDDALPRGSVSFGGVRKEICLALTPEAAPGDYVLVHAGFAIAVVDEDKARDLVSAFESLGE